MGMQLNTGDTGRTVTASADGSLYSKIFGSGCYVLAGGNEFSVEVQSNNLIKMNDGDLIMQGRHVYIPASDSESITINNGSQGMNRKDLIVARYTKTTEGKEDVSVYVIQGTSTEGTAVTPEYVEGNILQGAAAKDFPLYEVELSGINIVSVTKLFTVIEPYCDQVLKEIALLVVDNLLSTSDSLPLSAKQGKVLNESKQDKIKGAASTITESDLTASRALVSNSSGKVAVSAVTATELGYLDGATGNVQTQINNITTARAKNTFGTFVDLRGYSSDIFTCPSDGYVSVRASYRTNSKAQCSLYGATGTDFLTLHVAGGNGSTTDTTNTSNTVFVRKGMRVTQVSLGSSYDLCRFVPLT